MNVLLDFDTSLEAVEYLEEVFRGMEQNIITSCIAYLTSQYLSNQNLNVIMMLYLVRNPK
jgi:hypothetical protein